MELSMNKATIKQPLIGLLVLLCGLPVHARYDDLQQSEQIDQTLRFSGMGNKQLTVSNIYGSIEVTGYSGDEVLVSINKTVTADETDELDKGMQTIDYRFENLGSHIVMFVDLPFAEFDAETGQVSYQEYWQRMQGKKVKYHYHMDIQLKVPHDTSLRLSAINDGNIKVTGIEAEKLEVSNINGAIDMLDVAGDSTYVNAINKDINVQFSQNPTTHSEFESINGDLNVVFAEQPNAEVVYETMHGDVYTAYDVALMPPSVNLTSVEKRHGIKYKLDAASRLKIGAGGPEYSFKTLNGDIKIK